MPSETHPHPNASNPHAPPNFDFARFAAFCERGFSHGIGKEDGAVCIEAAISLCAGEGLGDKPSCVHPVIRDGAAMTQTKRVYVSLTSLRPEACFEVTRTPHPLGDEYTAELISGDVDMDELVDAEALAIDQARDEWGDPVKSGRITAEGRFR